MSDTPRTDEQVNGKPCTRFAIVAGDCLRDALVPAEFARELERENAKLREEINAARRALDPNDELTSLSVAEIAALRSIES